MSSVSLACCRSSWAQSLLLVQDIQFVELLALVIEIKMEEVADDSVKKDEGGRERQTRGLFLEHLWAGVSTWEIGGKWSLLSSACWEVPTRHFPYLIDFEPNAGSMQNEETAAVSMGGCRAQRAASADGHASWNRGSSSDCLVGRELCWGQPGFCLSLVCASALSLISAFHYSDLESFCSGPQNLKGIDCA